MEEKKLKEKPELREINQLPPKVSSYSSGCGGSYGSCGSCGSGTSGMGTGPNDCMSQDMYLALSDRGALQSEVYVCGWGWTLPGVTVYGSCGSCGSCGCGSCGSCGCGSCGSCGCGSCGSCGCGCGGSCGCGCGYGKPSPDYKKIDLRASADEIGKAIIQAMYQWSSNHVGSLDYLVDWESAIWTQDRAFISGYFYYGGKEVYWVITNNEASTGSYSGTHNTNLNNICTANTEEHPGFNNFEIQLKFCTNGNAIVLRTRDSETYYALRRATGI